MKVSSVSIVICTFNRAALLRETLAAIATTAGFADQSHFTRAFRRQFGCTPGDYRARTTPNVAAASTPPIGADTPLRAGRRRVR